MIDVAAARSKLKADVARLRNRSYNSATAPERLSQGDVDRLQDRIDVQITTLAAEVERLTVELDEFVRAFWKLNAERGALVSASHAWDEGHSAGLKAVDSRGRDNPYLASALEVTDEKRQRAERAVWEFLEDRLEDDLHLDLNDPQESSRFRLIVTSVTDAALEAALSTPTEGNEDENQAYDARLGDGDPR